MRGGRERCAAGEVESVTVTDLGDGEGYGAMEERSLPVFVGVAGCEVPSPLGFLDLGSRPFLGVLHG